MAAVRTADGTLWTWGVNNTGELGYADFDNRQTYGLGSVAGPGTPYQSTPKAVQMDNVIQVTAGGMDITLALKSDGTLWASAKDMVPLLSRLWMELNPRPGTATHRAGEASAARKAQ